MPEKIQNRFHLDLALQSFLLEEGDTFGRGLSVGAGVQITDILKGYTHWSLYRFSEESSYGTGPLSAWSAGIQLAPSLSKGLSPFLGLGFSLRRTLTERDAHRDGILMSLWTPPSVETEVLQSLYTDVELGFLFDIMERMRVGASAVIYVPLLEGEEELSPLGFRLSASIPLP